ncbi:enoyl-CoA hydratase [Aestuariispira insulae]|uniref:Enoyl-CoA hydratase domain-containing protein 3, mitochondrial n=1 Tax=Aestuariispira insulae TaxID=1461337 RepID=A0A3D9HVG2_9PROT|nr:enoyl-CoA hydratase [Aestuariispira insulae]RED53447.1 enoyl-CoA hydratase/carnithine racemase [Aestuariispira insulae]
MTEPQSNQVDAESLDNTGLVLRQDEDSVAFLTLNLPGAYNALSLAMMEAVLQELARLDQDPGIAAVVIKGSGKGFCAGHDLKEMRANPDVAFREKTFATCSAMMMAVTQLRQPVIAQIHGIATAAGCQLVASCDLAIAATDARFSTPGVNIGLFCSTPMVALSRAVSRKKAMEMLLTGDMIGAPEAAGIGLINKSVPSDLLDRAVKELAQKVASKSPLVLKTGKEAFYQQIDMPLAQAYDHCSRIMVENMAFKDAEEGIDAFIGKRPPVWKGE